MLKNYEGFFYFYLPTETCMCNPDLYTIKIADLKALETTFEHCIIQEKVQEQLK